MISEEIISEASLLDAFDGRNFGKTIEANPRPFLHMSVFKTLVGYHCGGTITGIMIDLGLIDKCDNVTPKGIELIRAAYSDQLMADTVYAKLSKVTP